MKLVGAEIAEAAKAGVNKPELLPKEFTTVIDVAGFLSDGQVLWMKGLNRYISASGISAYDKCFWYKCLMIVSFGRMLMILNWSLMFRRKD